MGFEDPEKRRERNRQARKKRKEAEQKAARLQAVSDRFPALFAAFTELSNLIGAEDPGEAGDNAPDADWDREFQFRELSTACNNVHHHIRRWVGLSLPPGTVLWPGPYRVGLDYCCGLNDDRTGLRTDDDRPAVEVLNEAELRCHCCQGVFQAR